MHHITVHKFEIVEFIDIFEEDCVKAVTLYDWTDYKAAHLPPFYVSIFNTFYCRTKKSGYQQKIFTSRFAIRIIYLQYGKIRRNEIHLDLYI